MALIAATHSLYLVQPSPTRKGLLAKLRLTQHAILQDHLQYKFRVRDNILIVLSSAAYFASPNMIMPTPIMMTHFWMKRKKNQELEKTGKLHYYWCKFLKSHDTVTELFIEYLGHAPLEI
jgi:hypothetical protein